MLRYGAVIQKGASQAAARSCQLASEQRLVQCSSGHKSNAATYEALVDNLSWRMYAGFAECGERGMSYKVKLSRGEIVAYVIAFLVLLLSLAIASRHLLG